MGEFYQMLDFGVRCNLYGFPIYTCSDFALRFIAKHSIVEDRSKCDGMNRAYTKALSIHRIAGKNLVEKWKPYVDKDLLKNEVKTKQIILQKTVHACRQSLFGRRVACDHRCRTWRQRSRRDGQLARGEGPHTVHLACA